MSGRGRALCLGLFVAALPLVGVEWRWRAHEGIAVPAGEAGRGYATIPHAYGTNGGGFHERDLPAAPDPSVRRVAVLGDSMTYGTTTAAETYTRRAEEILGPPWQILNFSQYGYDIAQSAATLRSRVWAYAPDLVVYASYGNDAVRTRLITAGRPPVLICVSSERELFPVFVRERSAILRRIEGAFLARGASDAPDYAFFRRGLRDLVAQTAQRGVPLLVFEQVPHVAAGLGRGGCTDDACVSRMEMSRAQGTIFDEEGVRHASALPYLQASGEMAFYAADRSDDEHPSPEGHRVIGAALAEILGGGH